MVVTPLEPVRITKLIIIWEIMGKGIKYKVQIITKVKCYACVLVQILNVKKGNYRALS